MFLSFIVMQIISSLEKFVHFFSTFKIHQARPDSNPQRAGLGPRAVCLTALS